MRKGECEGKREERSLEKSLEIGFETGKSKKRWTSQGKKNEGDSSKKCRKLSLKREKAGKTEISGRKRGGGGEAKNRALLPILQCYEVAKWVQMKFSRNFFR